VPASPLNPNREWAAMAKSLLGKYETPTLRNVDKSPRPDFVKAYMHNGYLKSLKEVVHFYNTGDALPTCKEGDRGEKISCWPAFGSIRSPIQPLKESLFKPKNCTCLANC
jgi:cytochrome c peroxidase